MSRHNCYMCTLDDSLVVTWIDPIIFLVLSANSSLALIDLEPVSLALCSFLLHLFHVHGFLLAWFLPSQWRAIDPIIFLVLSASTSFALIDLVLVSRALWSFLLHLFHVHGLLRGIVFAQTVTREDDLIKCTYREISLDQIISLNMIEAGIGIH